MNWTDISQMIVSNFVFVAQVINKRIALERYRVPDRLMTMMLLTRDTSNKIELVIEFESVSNEYADE